MHHPRNQAVVSRRGLLGLGGGLVGAGALAACGASIEATGVRAPAQGFDAAYAGEPVQLQFWNPFTGGDGPTMAKMVQAFNDVHPAITVSMTSLAADDLYAKVLPAVGTAQGPQIAIMHLDQLPTFALRGTILPLDEAVAALGLAESDYVPNAWQQAMYRGQRWGLPLDVFAHVQFWNRTLFDGAGRTGPIRGAELEQAMDDLQQAGTASPFWVSPGSWQLYLTLLAQFGGTLFDEAGGRASFDSEAGVEALSWMRGIITRGWSPSGVTDARPPFKNGSSAVIADLPAAIPDLLDTAPDLDWGVAPFPQVGSRPGAFANSHHFVLTQQSQSSPEIAQACTTFLGWITRNSATWTEAGNVPAHREARDTQQFQESPQASLAEDDVLSDLAFLPLVPNSRDIAANSYQRAVSQVVLGQAEPAAAAAFAARTAQNQLDSLRELYGI